MKIKCYSIKENQVLSYSKEKSHSSSSLTEKPGLPFSQPQSHLWLTDQTDQSARRKTHQCGYKTREQWGKTAAAVKWCSAADEMIRADEAQKSQWRGVGRVGWHFIPSPRTKCWKDWMKTSFYRDYCSYCVWMLMSGRWRQVEVLLVSNKKIQQSTDDKWTTWYPTLQHLKSVKRLQEIKSCSCAQLNLILCRYLVLISGDEWALRKDPNVTNETAFPRGKMKSFKNGCRLIRRAQMGWDGGKCLMNGTTKK